MGRSRFSDSSDEMNVWPAFTDLMSNAFMILSLLLLLAFVRLILIRTSAEEEALGWEQRYALLLSQQERLLAERDQLLVEQQDLQEEVEDLETRRDRLLGRFSALLGVNRSLRTDTQALNQQISSLQAENQELTVTVDRLSITPSIEIEASQGFTFQSGSAALSPELAQYLQGDVADQIESLARQYPDYIIQVIGHTDSRSVRRSSTLDQDLLRVVSSPDQSIEQLTPGSNADLGLMRALAVVKQLEQDPRLQSLDLTFRAYSAAQLYPPANSPAATDPQSDARRRIEIRLSPPAERSI